MRSFISSDDEGISRHDLTGNEPTEAARAHRRELAELDGALFHDLRGPLATIRSYLGFLEIDLKEHDEARIATDVESIRTAVERMGDVLTDAAKRARTARE